MAEPLALLALGAAVGLALVHLFAGAMRFLEGVPRNRWLSAAAGVSVSYVFLHLLPELAAGQAHLGEAAGPVMGVVERHTYLLALLGLLTFYGLDRLALRSRRDQRASEGDDSTETGVFWIHISSFTVYNGLIGYLLVHRNERSAAALAVFALAMALHFVVNDFGLREHHKEQYQRVGRWVLALAVLLGCLIGLATRIPEAAIAGVVAFLAGGIILNVLKEELPDERQSRFGALALGMAAYAAILLAI